MTTSRGKKIRKKKDSSVVDFRFQDVQYQIDPESRRVYRNYVSVETAKTFAIMNAWSQAQQQKA